MWSDELRRLIEAIPATEIDQGIGELEAGKARLYTRLLKPAEDGDHRVSGPELYNLTVYEVAQMVGLKPKTCYNHRQELGGKKIGASVRFSRRAVERYLAARR
jgi:excisionase family DNA binding protein